jgi:sirohydrochlorin ferrochelatase
MDALLLLAHGSPRPEANEPVLRLAGEIRKRNAFALVVVGYLDCNEPDIPAAIDLCVQGGATSIAAVPWFLHSGRHFVLDIPNLLEAGMRRHPGVRIRMGDYIGHMPQMREVVLDRVRGV